MRSEPPLAAASADQPAAAQAPLRRWDPLAWWRDASVAALVAGFVAVLVGYTSSVAIVFAAAQAVGADAAHTASWLWALGLGAGVTSLALSLWYREPVLTAWSTPGAALIAASHGYALDEATAAFIVCALGLTLAGYTGAFARLMNRIPAALAAALLAGVLARFALDAVLAVQVAPLLVLLMFIGFLLANRWWPRYAVLLALLIGVATAAWQGQLRVADVHWAWANPLWVTPRWSLGALVGLALPLFIVTMASQNLPGVAAQRAHGYHTPINPTVGATGLVSLLLAPFGGYALNLAAITAAICMNPHAHEDPRRRYIASSVAGCVYLLLGLAAGAIAGILAAFPKALIVGIAGLALLGTIASALTQAVAQADHRDAAVTTFLVTLSGVNIAGIGSAFWGIVAGGCVLALRQMVPAR